MNDIAFKEGENQIHFPPLKEEISENQIKAIDELIDNMDLMTADIGFDGQPCEAFEISSLREFKNQYYQYCVIQRGLYPDKPIPENIPLRMREAYTLPKSLIEPNKKAVDKIKQLFPISCVEQKKRFKRRIEENMMVAPGMNKEVEGERESNEAVIREFPKPEISQSEPLSIQNLKMLFKDYCFPSPKAIIWILKDKASISNLTIETILEELSKCIAERRAFLVTVNPNKYNSWLKELKEASVDHQMLNEYFVKTIAVKSGVISKEENVASNVKLEEAESFLEENLGSQVIVTSQDLAFDDFENLELELEMEEALNEVF